MKNFNSDNVNFKENRYPQSDSNMLRFWLLLFVLAAMAIYGFTANAQTRQYTEGQFVFQIKFDSYQKGKEELSNYNMFSNIIYHQIQEYFEIIEDVNGGHLEVIPTRKYKELDDREKLIAIGAVPIANDFLFYFKSAAESFLNQEQLKEWYWKQEVFAKVIDYALREHAENEKNEKGN